MGKYINKNVIIDPESGEVLKEKFWVGYDGFCEKGYRYRNRALHIRYYFDSLPDNYDSDTLLLLFMIAELMNEENVLVYKVKRKSKSEQKERALEALDRVGLKDKATLFITFNLGNKLYC